MPQYNNQYTYEALQKLKLSVVPDTLDKREGSVIWNTISANSYALSMAFMQMGINQNNMFPDTASRKYLIRHCAQRGISPKEATCAVIKGKFVTSTVTGTPYNPKIGTRFTVDNSTLIYVVTEQIEDGIFNLTCETPGTSGNRMAGTLIPLEEIQALGSASIIELVESGENEEDTEALRERYMASLEVQAFGGNKAAYREYVTDIENVGACKVHRAYGGQGGHVGLCILDRDLELPDAELIQTVQNEVDPTQDGAGEGFAPIDHIVTVFSPTETSLDVNVTITPADEMTKWENISQSVTDIVKAYIYELKETWDVEEKIIVRPVHIMSRLLTLDMILDVSECRVNGSTNNLELGINEIPKVGVVSGDIEFN